MFEYNGNGIWIPVEILHNEELTSTEKILYAEIYYLDRPDTHCTATNEYLSEFLNMSESGIKKCLSHLRDLGYIHTASFDGRKRSLAVSVKWKSDSSIQQTDTPVDSRQTLECPADSYKNEFLLYRENNRENNREAGEACSPGNTRRNFRKEHEVLTDDLESGKVIDTEKKEKKKKTNYEKCLDELSSRNFSDDVKELLEKHLQWSYNSKDPKRIRDRATYKSKLNFLEQLQKKGEDLKKVVQQSIDREWHAFYEFKNETVSKTQYEPLADRVVMNNPEEAKEVLEKLRSDPNRKVY
jgi:hypothetical protein